MTESIEFVLAGVRMKQLLSGQETAGAFSLFENRSDGLSSTPIHVHAYEDETIYLLAGEMRAIVAGQAHSLQVGESLFLPRGIPHQLMNASGAPARYLLLCNPSGFERFLAEAGHRRMDGEDLPGPTAADREFIQAAAPKFGITLLSGW